MPKMVQKGFSVIFIIIVIHILIIIVGIIIYLVFLKQKPELNQLLPLPVISQKQISAKGCGNGLCEGGETYDLCPADCILPSSIEPKLKSILITESDLPLTPAPNKEPWVKQIDIQIDQSYVGLAPKDIKPLTGWQVTYYPLPHDSVAWIVQMILVYPLDKIKGVFQTIDATLIDLKKVETEVEIEELPIPNIGEESRAFRAGSQGSSQFIIVFYKKGFFEMLTFRGSAFEYKVLEDIARKAADKIQ